jgi:hypothetical protein
MAKDKKMSGFKKAAIGLGSTAGGSMGISLLDNLARAFGLYKDGGRVRGVGKATHGYGKAMKNQGRKK